MARASLATALRDLDGDISFRGQSEWLAWGCAEFLKGGTMT